MPSRQEWEQLCRGTNDTARMLDRSPIVKGDRLIRGRSDFPEMVKQLAARGFDAGRTLFLDHRNIPGGVKDLDFLLVLPTGEWVWIEWVEGQLHEWWEGRREEYGDDFQAMVTECARGLPH